MPKPPEGVVDTATISTTKGGKSQKVISGPKALWVRFHFLDPADRREDGEDRLAHPELPVRRRRHQAVRDDDRLDPRVERGPAEGTWYAIMNVDGKVAKRQDVRVT